MLAAGDQQGARAVISDLADGPRSTVDALRAAALFASEDNRPQEAAALVARLPPSARTAQMRSLQSDAQLAADIQSATLLGGGAARARLLMLAASPDPDGTRGALIARAFIGLGDPAGAGDAIATALAATRSPASGQRIQYAGALLEAGQEQEARAMLHGIDATGGLTAVQGAAISRLRAGMAVRSSDQLARDGQYADAYDRLAPALARDPQSPDLNMALARLYQASGEPRHAFDINTALLRREPNNIDARRAAVGAAIELGDYEQAGKLVEEARRLTPDNPRTWLMSAELNKARGKNRQALQDLRAAQALRQQETRHRAKRQPNPLGCRWVRDRAAELATERAAGAGESRNAVLSDRLTRSQLCARLCRSQPVPSPR